MKTLATLLLALAAALAQAQTYPSRPVTIVVPFGAGGPADIYARFLGSRMQEPLGQPVVVENRPGGGSVVGSDAVAKSAPDGYTLLMMSNTHTVNETLIPNKPFVLLRDLAPVAPVNYSDLLLVVHPSVPANNLKELIALAKSQPGKMNYASSGPGTPYHMAGELFKSMAGVDVVHVPYKGSDGARVGILGGQVQMMFDAITTMAPNVRAGKAQGLRHQRPRALQRAARHADGGRSGRAGLRGDDLARRHGARRHAQADHRPPERRDHESDRPRGGEGGLGQAGRHGPAP